MNKIEQVALAIGCIDADRCIYGNSNVKSKIALRGTCKECLATAKSAIEAMREPTEAMLDAHEFNNCFGATEQYRAMIDAALKED